VTRNPNALLNQALTAIPKTGSDLIFSPFGPTTTAVRQNDIAGQGLKNQRHPDRRLMRAYKGKAGNIVMQD